MSKELVIDGLLALDAEDRCAVFNQFCTDCGETVQKCACWDELIKAREINEKE
jgi:hypothetical protein